MSKKIGEQSLLKYEKLYNWGRTLITSGVIQNEDKFPSENILQKKFGYSRQTVRTALNQLEAEGLIKRVKGSGTYVSYEGNLRNGERPRIGLILSYFSDYLFPRVYDGIDSVMKEAGYDIDVAVTKNRLNDEAIYLEGLLNGNVAGFIIEGTRSFFPNPNIRLYEEIRKRNIPTLFIHNHYSNQRFDSVEMSDARAAYKLTEILIQKSLDELCKGRTTIVVAHRLSTVRNADRIAVVDEGHIIEEGTHKELLEKGGEYAALYNAQLRVDA